MPEKHGQNAVITLSEGQTTRLSLATLRVGLATDQDARHAVRAQLTIQPQPVETEQQMADGSSQPIKLVIGLSHLNVLLLIEGGEFTFDPVYTVKVDPDAFRMAQMRERECASEGQAGVAAKFSTPPGTPFVSGEFNANAHRRASDKATRTEAATPQLFLVNSDTAPPDADPDAVRRWKIGTSDTGGDPERGVPYLSGDTYLNRDDRPLATFEASNGANRIAIDLALAIQREDLHVTCTDADTGKAIDSDMIKVKARLAQIYISRAIKKNFDTERVTTAIKDGEILIVVTHKEKSL